MNLTSKFKTNSFVKAFRFLNKLKQWKITFQEICTSKGRKGKHTPFLSSLGPIKILIYCQCSLVYLIIVWRKTPISLPNKPNISLPNISLFGRKVTKVIKNKFSTTREAIT